MGTTPKILDANVKQDVQYCIPLWLRDEQVLHASARTIPRIQPYDPEATRPEPIAVVCYGPSLADTWEQIKNFKYIISCSGAHKFLLDRGIVPTWHVEVDPREHKIKLVGEPHPDVEYLVASTCHPKYFDHLLERTSKVTLWHVFANEADALRTMPRGEWALTGGSSVGLRSLTIARFLGFTDLHIFGMDGSEGVTGKHAAEHPNQPPGYSITVYDGVEYRTTKSMLECARQTWHELDQLPGVKATFYGEGLVQHMARNYVPKPCGKGLTLIGLAQPELISTEYAALNKRLHSDNLAYGVGGGKHAPTVLRLAAAIPTHSILDYGCGKGYLQKEIPFPIWEYDPGVPGKEELPRPADLVVCTDVLEHIEPEKLDAVLNDLRRCVRRVGYFIIHTGPSTKFLADGRNAHLIQENATWWQQKLAQFFLIGKVRQFGPLVEVLVGARPAKPKKMKPVVSPSEGVPA